MKHVYNNGRLRVYPLLFWAPSKQKRRTDIPNPPWLSIYLGGRAGSTIHIGGTKRFIQPGEFRAFGLSGLIPGGGNWALVVHARVRPKAEVQFHSI